MREKIDLFISTIFGAEQTCGTQFMGERSRWSDGERKKKVEKSKWKSRK